MKNLKKSIMLATALFVTTGAIASDDYKGYKENKDYKQSKYHDNKGYKKHNGYKNHDKKERR